MDAITVLNCLFFYQLKGHLHALNIGKRVPRNIFRPPTRAHITYMYYMVTQNMLHKAKIYLFREKKIRFATAPDLIKFL